jgi:hypothetical protein
MQQHLLINGPQAQQATATKETEIIDQTHASAETPLRAQTQASKTLCT